MPKKDTDVRKVRIDVEVHRAIEAGRVKFDESENAILRRLLGIDARPSVPRPAMRQPRSSGAYSILMGETPVEANSLKELLRRALLLAEKRQPGLLDRLAAMPTSRGRYLVARDPTALYPRSPQLAGYAEPLTAGWWYDTNVSRGQVAGYLALLARELKLAAIPAIAKRLEKSAMTPADLGLE